MDLHSALKLLHHYEHLACAVVLLLESPPDLKNYYMKLLSNALAKVNEHIYPI